MDLGFGEAFGEDYICFNLPNYYSVKVESTSMAVLSIEQSEYFKKYKKITPYMKSHFRKRQDLI